MIAIAEKEREFTQAHYLDLYTEKDSKHTIH